MANQRVQGYSLWFEMPKRVNPPRALMEDATMAWNTPKVAEVQVGMEINMYACAKQK